MSEFDTAVARLGGHYNALTHNPESNPGGLAAGGHRQNFVPALRDMATVAVEVASDAVLARQAAEDVRAATLSGGGLVLASPSDTTAGSLVNKIEAAGLDVEIVNPGGAERLRLTAQPAVGSVLHLAVTCNAF